MIWLALLFLLIGSGVVSACETALFGLNRQTLHEFRGGGTGLKHRAWSLMQHPHRVLMTVLISNTALNITFYAVSFVAFQSLSAALATIAGVGSLFAIIILGELVPKAVALGNARSLAPSAAGIISALQSLLGLLVWILSKLLVDPLTRLLAPATAPPVTVDLEELTLLVEHSARAGHIDTTENELLQSIVALPEASVREVMTPRVDIEFLRLSDGPRQRLNTIRSSRRRILPVCGRDLDDVRGVIVARDVLLHPAAAIHSLLRPARFVPEQINLAQVVQHFRGDKSHFAVVVDEYGGTSGLVTVDDVVEWIVGDLPESEAPHSKAPTERIDDNTYLLDGDLSVRDWAERFGVGEISRHVDTLAGLILSKLGRLPRRGEVVRVRNLTLTVESVHRRRIDRVLLHRDAEPNGQESGV